MEHLENITQWIESSTFSVIGKQLQDLLLKKQREFFVQELENKLRQALMPYLKEIPYDFTFNVTLKKEGDISINLPDLNVESEFSEDDDLDFPYDSSDSASFLDNNADDNIICLSDAKRIEGNMLNKGFLLIDPHFNYFIERILNLPIQDLIDIPVDIEFDDRLYEDATLNYIRRANGYKTSDILLQLKWPCTSSLGRDLRAVVGTGSRTLRYKYFTLSYKKSNTCFQIKLFKENPF